MQSYWIESKNVDGKKEGKNEKKKKKWPYYKL